MIISTSSHNVLLTNEVCDYVEAALRKELGHNADRVVSVDARLEADQPSPGRNTVRVAVRVDLPGHRPLTREFAADDVYAAVRRSAAGTARAVDRQLRHSREVIEQRRPRPYHAFARYSAANI